MDDYPTLDLEGNSTRDSNMFEGRGETDNLDHNKAVELGDFVVVEYPKIFEEM